MLQDAWPLPQPLPSKAVMSSTASRQCLLKSSVTTHDITPPFQIHRGKGEQPHPLPPRGDGRCSHGQEDTVIPQGEEPLSSHDVYTHTLSKKAMEVSVSYPHPELAGLWNTVSLQKAQGHFCHLDKESVHTEEGNGSLLRGQPYSIHLIPSSKSVKQEPCSI